MIRKTLNIILLFGFLYSSMGFTITQHYCGNKLVRVSLLHVENCCAHCNHCHNTVRNIKIKDSYDSYRDIFSFVNFGEFSTILKNRCDFLLEKIIPESSIFCDISPPHLSFENSFFQVFRK